ncbi:MAG: outer membrane lipoprotein-sorting protein [Deltaproteobacteria bacterium]|nr:MAG: outer membrane lipoprotein-sorting protein [Deltaproteobacteria bacterium]
MTEIKLNKGILLIPALICLLAVTSVRAEEIVASELLSKMGNSKVKVNFRGNQVVISFQVPNPNVSRVLVAQLIPNLGKKEIISSTGESTEVIIEDGKYQWRYIPSHRLIIKRPQENPDEARERANENIKLVQKNYYVKVGEKQNLVNRSTFVITLQPRVANRPKHWIWVDKDSGVPLKTEVYSTKGQLAMVSTYSKIDFAPNLTGEDFKLQIPKKESVREMEEKANLELASAEKLFGEKVMLPNYLPSGFILRDIALSFIGGKRRLQLLYSDGLSSVSVFQETGRSLPGKGIAFQKGVKRTEPLSYSRGLNNIMGFPIGNRQIMLVGDISEEEIAKIAQSLP